MPLSALISWVVPSLLLSLRIAPVFAFAPPFTLTPAPVLFRALFAVGIAACLVAAHPSATVVSDLSLANLSAIALRELMLGSIFVLAFQLMFGALYMAGRTIDIQAGYGLAMLIDPTTQTQVPLIGTVFALLAGGVFFALNGHADLLRIFAASLDAIPLGSGVFPSSLARLSEFMSVMFLTSFGVAGGVVLSLFVVDLAIAMLSRTVPQMNVLILGFQVKSIMLFLVLPLTLGLAATLLTRMARLTLETLPGLL